MGVLKTRVALFCSLFLIVFNPAQGSGKALSDKYQPRAQQLPSFASEAEKVVKAVYEKLARLNKASLLLDDRSDAKLPVVDRYLKFELSNFKVGPIQEILGLPHPEVVTYGSGETLEIIRVVTVVNDRDRHVAYRADWTSSEYSSGYDPGWTVGDLMSYSIGKYHDVGAYASYDVSVSLRGKKRTYKAAALFHNPYGATRDLKPSFCDGMIASGGSLNDIWSEKLPVVGEKAGSTAEPKFKGSQSFYTPTANQSVSSPWISNQQFPFGRTLKVRPALWSPSQLPLTTTAETSDSTEHSSGGHGQQVDFEGTCVAISNANQECKVKMTWTYTYENGTVTNRLYRHRFKIDESLGSHTGARGTPISCVTGRGIAVKNCLPEPAGCELTGALVGSGLTMQMTGGDVWRGQVVHGHTCNISKPPGMCFDSSTPLLTASAKTSSSNASAPTLADPSCCGADEQFDCINGGGEWNNFSCTCLSPIVIDVAGNGFDLTDAADGVLFDLARTGLAEQISWTSANSDDAWLVLDRNGNSIIDDGRELFGSATPQPYLAEGESKNGFRALAIFDKPENGGNDDGRIDSRDAIFTSLKLWQDRNHNGVSEGGELLSLTQSAISAIELSYKESRRTDEHGNWFRYRAKVSDGQNAQMGRWAYDVFVQRVK